MKTVEVSTANGVKVHVNWQEICRVYEHHRSDSSGDFYLGKVHLAKEKLEKLSGELVHDCQSAVAALYKSGKLSYPDCEAISAMVEFLLGSMLLEQENINISRHKQQHRENVNQ